MTRRELIQFMDELVELASEENKETEIVFVGGGANVVKRFGNYDGNNIQYIEDCLPIRSSLPS